MMKLYALILSLLALCVLGQRGYTYGAIRTAQAFQYGKFEVRLKGVPATGIVTGAFLYYDFGEDETKWAEITFETKQQDTGHISNVITWNNGQRNVRTRDLNMQRVGDAKQDFHVVVIEWGPTAINFYVDGQLLTSETDPTILARYSNRPSKFHLNTWASDFDALNGFGGKLSTPAIPVYSSIDYVKVYSYTANTFATSPIWVDDFNAFDDSRWEWDAAVFDGNLAVPNFFDCVQINSGFLRLYVNQAASPGTQLVTDPQLKNKDNWITTTSQGGVANFQSGSGGLSINIVNGGQQEYSVQLSQNLQLTKNQLYYVELELQFNQNNRIFNVRVDNPASFSDQEKFFGIMSLSSSSATKTYSWYFGSPLSGQYRIALNFGGSTFSGVNVKVSGISVKKVDANTNPVDSTWLSKAGELLFNPQLKTNAAWSLINNGASFLPSFSASGFSTSLTTLGTQTSSLRLLQDNVPIQQNQVYYVTFTAKASVTARVQVSVVDSNYLTTIYGGTNNFELTTSFKTFNYWFTAEKSDSKAKAIADFGGGLLAPIGAQIDIQLFSIKTSNVPSGRTEPTPVATATAATSAATSSAATTTAAATSDNSDSADGTVTAGPQTSVSVPPVTSFTCKNKPARIIFVVDRSASITQPSSGGQPNNALVIKNGLKSVVQTFANTDSQIALVYFGTKATVSLGFTSIKTGAATINSAIDNLPFWKSGAITDYYTNWEDGLIKANSLINGQPSQVIFITDGKPNTVGSGPGNNAGSSTALSRAQTQKTTIENSGSKIFGVGVGSSINEANLEKITSTGSNVIIGDFDEFYELLQTSLGVVCDEDNVVAPTGTVATTTTTKASTTVVATTTSAPTSTAVSTTKSATTTEAEVSVSLGSLTTVSVPPVTTFSCSNKPARILFVVDRSASITQPSSGGQPNNALIIKNGLKSVVQTFSNTDSQMGLVYFGTQATVSLGFTSTRTGAATINSAIDNIPFWKSGAITDYYTNWEDGLIKALSLINNQATQVIFITDGKPNTIGSGPGNNAGSSTAFSRAQTQKTNIENKDSKIFAVGIGSSINEANLQKISSSGTDLAVGDFDEFFQLLQKSLGVVCDKSNVVNPVTTVATTTKTATTVATTVATTAATTTKTATASSAASTTKTATATSTSSNSNCSGLSGLISQLFGSSCSSSTTGGSTSGSSDDTSSSSSSSGSTGRLLRRRRW